MAHCIRRDFVPVDQLHSAFSLFHPDCAHFVAWLKDLEHPNLFCVGAIGAPGGDQLSCKESLHRSLREQSSHRTPSSIRTLRSRTSTVSDIAGRDIHSQTTYPLTKCHDHRSLQAIAMTTAIGGERSSTVVLLFAAQTHRKR